MTDQVIDIEEYLASLPNLTTPAEEPSLNTAMLEIAKDKLESGMVVGWGNDGLLFFVSSIVDKTEILWTLEKAKQALLEAEEEED